MPKLPSLTPQKIIKVLEKKGFVLDRIKGSHHIYYHLETKRRVVIPLHKRDLPKGTLLEIIKQAGISKEELRDILWVKNFPQHRQHIRYGLTPFGTLLPLLAASSSTSRILRHSLSSIAGNAADWQALWHSIAAQITPPALAIQPHSCLPSSIRSMQQYQAPGDCRLPPGNPLTH